jgi:CDP-diacylglycerol--glycerol-3-phosphate 3-phosphatidyltransferase
MKFNKSDIFNISNSLSMLRVVLVIPVWILMDSLDNPENRYIVAGLCLFAAITDMLDGHFARKLNQVTEFGKIVDPIADKIIVSAVVVKLFLIGDIPGYYFYMIVARDILILIGGIIVTKKLGKVLPSNVLGKITVIFISVVLLLSILQVSSGFIFNALYYASLVLIVGSLAAYTIRALEFIKKSEDESVRKFQF